MPRPVTNQSFGFYVCHSMDQPLSLNTRAIRILTLAAQKRCEGAPSLVPDYLRNLADFSSSQSARNKIGLPKQRAVTYNSLLYIKFHPDNDDIIIVKGFILEQITEIRSSLVEIFRRSPEPITYQLWTRIKTPSYRGVTYNNVSIGDKVALIVGVSIPLVVRVHLQAFTVKMKNIFFIAPSCWETCGGHASCGATENGLRSRITVPTLEIRRGPIR
jgi:hypothetical protein